MNDGFFFGFWLAIWLCTFLFFVVFHLNESRCQREHNVADCVMIEDPFVPYDAERAG